MPMPLYPLLALPSVQAALGRECSQTRNLSEAKVDLERADSWELPTECNLKLGGQNYS